MSMLIEKIADVLRSFQWKQEKWVDEAEDVLAAVRDHYSDPANVTDAMCEAAIMSWDTAETEGVLDDWKHAIAAAMKAQ